MGLYYLNTRYYNSQIGRLVNLDTYINANGDILGFNMFAYCSNNPVRHTDKFGTTFLYDPNELDWASSYSAEQLDMINHIGVDEFSQYDSSIQDAMLAYALQGGKHAETEALINEYLLEYAAQQANYQIYSTSFAYHYATDKKISEFYEEPYVQGLLSSTIGWVPKPAKILYETGKSVILNWDEPWMIIWDICSVCEDDSSLINIYNSYQQFKSLANSVR